MPIYEYECLECGSHFDLRQSVDPAATVSPATCPAGHTSVRRLLSRPAIIFKGSGFYVTDHGRNGGGRVSSQGRSPAKSAAAQETDDPSPSTP